MKMCYFTLQYYFVLNMPKRCLQSKQHHSFYNDKRGWPSVSHARRLDLSYQRISSWDELGCMLARPSKDQTWNVFFQKLHWRSHALCCFYTSGMYCNLGSNPTLTYKIHNSYVFRLYCSKERLNESSYWRNRLNKGFIRIFEV